MTGSEFKAALRELKISQRKFCEDTGVSEPTANRWAGSKKDIPPLAAAYLRLKLDVHRLQTK